MKVTQVETIRLEEFSNLLFVRVHTSEGFVGLGETWFGAKAVEAYIHETAAPYLLGKDPLEIDRHARALSGYLGYRSSGAETRGNSAIDIALWDVFGKVARQPVYQLLGGASRERIRTYNTCAGYRYVRNSSQAVSGWGLPEGEPEGPYEDLDGFLNHADVLAQSLLADGITGMKIWPFDIYAEESGGSYISPENLDRALEPFRLIRTAVGNRMDIMVEFHSLWNLPTAIQIATALRPFNPAWFEDPIRADNIDALAAFAAATDIPTVASETLSGRASFREVLEKQAARIIMLDLSWVGGLSEAKKIATMAEAYHVPIAPHDCTGPVVLTASTHLSINATNAMVQESVRAFYTGWYRELVTALPDISKGTIAPPPGDGLGIELRPEVLQRPDTHQRISQ
jgi:L-alanine-DL-glutamate epimerase-like enolase superfamily enzyme